MSVSKPIQLIIDAQKMKVQIELMDNTLISGTLVQSDYNLNIELVNVTFEQSKEHCERLLIRGSQVKFVSLPKALANSPVLQDRPIRGNGQPTVFEKLVKQKK